MRRLDKAAFLILIVLAVIGQIVRGGLDVPDGDRTPRRPAPHSFDGALWEAETEGFAMAPRESRAAPGSRLPLVKEAVIEVGPRTSSGTGTAFPVADGVWMTARHVIEGCSKAGIQVDHKRAIRIRKTIHHPNADVSLVFVDHVTSAFPVAVAVNGDNGFHMGFPAGRPGALHGDRLGTTRLRYDGAYRVRETVTAWSEVSRVPSGSGSLGGMSGGPVFDDRGRVIGVVLAEAQRRGRTYTATPTTLAEIADLGDVTLTTGTDRTIDGDDYGNVARDLILDLRVARVLCIGPA